MRQTAPEGRGPPSYFSRICLLHIKSRTFLRGDKHITHTLAHFLMRRLRPLRAAALPAISPAYAYYTLNREPFCAGINTSLTPSRTLSCDRRAALQRPSQLFIPHNKEFIPLYSILTNYPLLFTHCSRPNHCSLLISHCSFLTILCGGHEESAKPGGPCAFLYFSS